MKKIIALIIIISAIELTAAEKTIPLHIGKNLFTVEIADSDQERRRGLMFRNSLGENRGMLFIHDREDFYGYWMKNCKISLDIIFIGRNRRVVDIHENVPPCYYFPCPSYRTSEPALYVLELKGGRASQIGLVKGRVIRFKLK